MRPNALWRTAWLFAVLLTPAGADATSPHSLPGFAYVSPAPGTRMHMQRTNIIVRPGGAVRAASLDPATTITVSGSATGAHEGAFRLADDGETILFRPTRSFYSGETVTCTVAPGIDVQGRAPLPGATFTFQIVGLGPEPPQEPLAAMAAEWSDVIGPGGLASPRFLPSIAPTVGSAPEAGAAPPLSTMLDGTTAPGVLFLSDFRFGDASYRSHLMIVRNDGSIVFERELEGQGFDFKPQPDGRLTYYDAIRKVYYALDASYALVDSFRCGNGYVTDNHDLRVLENGHALLLSYDARHIDMTEVVPGGQANAIVTGLVVQELDREKEVVFQWRSWDHFRLTDTTHRSLTGPTLDYVHGNAVERDHDGNLLISSRHMDEITKIDRTTGAIRWRLGGTNNQFTFVNDPDGFSHQHAVRRLPNGNIILFDNGNFHVPQYSRAVEYALDENAKAATLVWQYRHDPDVYGGALGYVQRLENGNTLISWGAASITVTEVAPNGKTVFEGSLPAPLYSYRVVRHEWPPSRSARLSIEPRVLAATARGRWVTATIDPIGFAADDLDRSRLTLAGDLAPDPTWSGPAEGNDQSRGAFRVRFDRAALLTRLHAGPNDVELAGWLRSGERFRARAAVRVVGLGPSVRTAPRVLSAPGALPVLLRPATPAGTATLEAFDVRGRLVRRWTASPDEDGTVAWDGRGRGGSRVPAGVYFVREARGAPASRVVIAR